MTFLTKPSLVVKKTPLIEAKCDEEVIEVQPPSSYWSNETRLSLSTLFCMTLAAFFVTLVGITTGFMLYRQYIRGNTVHRYQGFCTIPINVKESYEPQYRVMPLRWSAAPQEDAAVQVLSSAPDRAADELLSALREELDIGDSVEKISVFDNGRQVNFIHDFEANLTGIVDAERCFSMSLDPLTTLSPEVFVVSIEGGSAFDVSRVRSSVRAVLPALASLASLAGTELADACADRPVYRLLEEQGVVIRKRSVEKPIPDYIQFAGKHVQEIDILNLNDILQHEQQNKK